MIQKLVISALSILIVCSSFTTIEDSDKLSWYDIEEVQKLAKEKPKNVFIDFTAKWCGWCKVMDKKTFTDPAVMEYLNENYYAVKLDFDSPREFSYLGEKYTAKELAKENGITGLPTMLVANSDFSRIEKIIGYQKPKPFINRLKEFNE